MKNSKKNSFRVIWLLLFLAGCAGIRQAVLKKELSRLPKTSPVISQYFLGLSLYDPQSQSYLLDVNGDKYFTPASNTKLLTLATWLSTDLDSIPAFRYRHDGHNLYIQPLADPTFLHPDFPIQDAFDFLYDTSYDTLFVIPPSASLSPFGSGWAWDDYAYPYMPERSYLPLYGNVLHAFFDRGKTEIVPEFFAAFVEEKGQQAIRSKDYNVFQIPPSGYDIHREVKLPYRWNEELMVRLLQDTLGRPVLISKNTDISSTAELLYGYDRLPVLAQMMLRSDNFLAEHLLLNAGYFQGYTDMGMFIDDTKGSLFADCPQPPEWVDGSGLSRYNMMTPNSMVKVLETIYRQLSWKEITLIFPKGGVSGTIKNWYAAETPYIYAKTGTLRHNHCLSGFIVTRSGRQLIFSIMNNHYTGSSTRVKQEMQKILEAIRDAY